MNTQTQEQVLVVPASFINEQYPKVWSPANFVIGKFLLNSTFRFRAEAETNLEFKQVIPYVLVNYGDLYLLARRTDKQEEKRLHGKYSIGQGGHVNKLDTTMSDAIVGCILREVREEFHLGPFEMCSPVGVINDNSSDVGKVHVGLVYRLTVSNSTLSVAEVDKHEEVKWSDVLGLHKYKANMESWSQIVVSNCF